MFTDYQTALNFLYEKLPMFSRQGQVAYKPGLERVQCIAEKFGNPHIGLKAIHIAGTNGKGSCSHILASVFQTAGYKTGLYTSPHLFDFGERIKINGQHINKDFLIDFVNKSLPYIDEIQPSFFELTVVMAFCYFKENNVDIAIIETGLGGLLDSTNIIQPIISLITNISYDHQQILGNTLSEIAAQKAGIIKEKTPCILSEFQEEVYDVFDTYASDKNAPLIVADKNFKAKWLYYDEFEIFDDYGFSMKFKPDLIGNYQQKNYLGCWQTIFYMQEKLGWKNLIENFSKACSNVKSNTNFLGRWQKLFNTPLIFVDVGHNVAGMKEIIFQIRYEKQKTEINKVFIIIGMVKDKDIRKVIQLLPQEYNYIFTQSGNPRSMSAEDLSEIANEENIDGLIINDVNEAFSEVLKMAADNDLVVVCGSVFLVGELLEKLSTQ